MFRLVYANAAYWRHKFVVDLRMVINAGSRISPTTISWVAADFGHQFDAHLHIQDVGKEFFTNVYGGSKYFTRESELVLSGQGSKALALPCPAFKSPALALPSPRPGRARGSGFAREKPEPEAPALGLSTTLSRRNYRHKTPKSDLQIHLTSSSPRLEPWPSPALPQPVPEAQAVKFTKPCL
ncbi:hypothetical protein BD410DRAFT_808046 [Rickenella mellea]|uniref:Uncharacterized protein n=1 Tax=Rickenella mellea TaxID=50990 RepID=A0A4Y7PM89_9AGAM|nr:hypothetical protein BD410DRAFT_808046 [Rickenella mellea]